MRNAILNKLVKILDSIAYKLEGAKKPVKPHPATKPGKGNLPLRYEDRY